MLHVYVHMFGLHCPFILWVFGCFTFIKMDNIKNIVCQPRLHADRSRDPS